MKKLSYSLFSLITIFLFEINQINTQDSISDVYIYGYSNSPTEGQGNHESSLGGTIFYVKGSGFDSILDNNNVYVGDKKATILGSNQAFLIFQSPINSKQEDLPLSVQVKDKRGACVNTDCKIYYRWGKTPELRRLRPRSGGPTEYINFFGVGRADTSESIVDMKIGPFVCDRIALDFEDYDINGLLNYRCRVAPEMNAGYYKSTFKTDFGYAYNWPTYPIIGNGYNYEFQCIPLVLNVSSNVGSPKGQIITITGYGFSLKKEDTKVMVGSFPCLVIEADTYTIRCEIQSDALKDQLVSIKGSGIEKWVYNGRKSDLFTISNGLLFTAFWANTIIPSTLISYSIESEIDTYPNEVEAYIMEVWKGYLKVPVSGKYRFYMTADDNSELYLSSKPNSNDPQFLNKIAYDYTYNYYELPYYKDNIISTEFQLEKGQFYLLYAARNQGGGNSHMWIGLEAPSDVWTPSSIASVQRIDILFGSVVREVIHLNITNFKKNSGYKIVMQSRDLNTGLNDFYQETTQILYDDETNNLRSTFTNQFKWAVPVITKYRYLADDSLITDTKLNNQTYKISYVIEFGVLRPEVLRPNKPILGIKLTDSSDTQTSIVIKTVKEPSPPITGDFTLNFNGTSIGPIPGNTNYIANYLNVLNLDRNMYSDNIGTFHDEHYYLIRLNGLKGIIPLMTVEKNNLIGGLGTPKIIIKEMIKGSNNIYYDPIPSEFLYTVAKNPTVVVTSNGITGKCPNENCEYAINTEITPSLDGFSVTADGLTLTISNYDKVSVTKESTTVQFGGALCTISNVVLPTITCTIAKNSGNSLMVPAGTHIPIVHVEKIGYLIPSNTLNGFSVDLIANSIDQTTGSLKGGQQIKVLGTGFPLSLKNLPKSFAVKLDSKICEIVEVSNTQIIFKTPISAKTETNEAILSIELNGLTVSNLKFTYDDNLTPIIESLSSNSASPSQKAELIITGSKFGTDPSKIHVLLDNSTMTNIYELSILTIKDTELKVVLGGGRAGQYTIRIEKEGIGSSKLATANANKFSYEILVEQITPNKGSIYGGTILTIVGKNFSPIKNQNQVFLGEEVNIYCDIIEATNVLLKCKTRAAPLSYIEKEQKIYVTQRIQDNAVCKVTNGCVFFYTKDYTPSIKTATYTLKADSVQQIEGTKLTPDALGKISIEFISANNDLYGDFTTKDIIIGELVDDTHFKFNMPAIIYGTYNSKVLVGNKGYAGEVITIINPLEVTDLIINEGKLIKTSTISQGGAFLNITGNGFTGQEKLCINAEWNLCRKINGTTQWVTCITPPNLEAKQHIIYIRNVKIDYKCTNCVFTATVDSSPAIWNIANPLTEVTSTFQFSSIEGNFLNRSTISPIPYLIQLDSLNQTVINQIKGEVVSVTDKAKIVTSFKDVPNGLYRINIYYPEYGYATINDKYKYIFVMVSNLVLNNVVSSLYGGKTIKITGNTFPDMKIEKLNNITICDSICKFVSQTETTVDCIIPKLLTLNFLTNYNLKSQEIIFQTNYAISSDIPANQININDGKTSSFYDSASQTCYVTFDFGLNFVVFFQEIHYYPSLSRKLQDFYGLIFEVSNDNQEYTKLFDINKNNKNGWNIYEVSSSTPGYRFFRLRNYSPLTSRCNIAEVKFYGVKTYSKFNALSLTSLKCDTVLQLSGKSYTISNSIEYKESELSVVKGISPILGPSSGGTDVTITGTGFGTDKTLVEIIIDTIICVVKSCTETTIVCTTGVRKDFVPSSFVVKIKGNNAITNGFIFSYIDRWSDPNTWGGESPPRMGDSVFIPSGQNVLLDISTPILYSVVIEGALIFEDKNLEFSAYFLICMEGRVQIGTRSNPFKSRLTITMYGDRHEGAQLPEYGNKVWAFHKATLDMHGSPKQFTWTLLDKTANIGDSTILVKDPVDWAVGDLIAIASTDFNHNNSETRIIKAISNDKKTLTLDFPLNNKHFSGIDTYGTFKIPMQAEVALLTRNILFRGDDFEESVIEKYGAHLMLHMPGSIGRITYTEFYKVGQGTIIGRYPMHFHRIEDASESYVIGNAVHESWARIVAIHNTHFLTVQKNVGYRVFGHNYFIEDGIETNNLIEDNLGISTIQIWTLINTDVTAATFWITNPNNIVRRNRAAGGDWFGFWYQLENRVTGPSYNPNICPDGVEMGIFTDNVAHSYNAFGLRIYEYIPRVFPCTDHSKFSQDDWYLENPPIAVVFENFIAWKNFENGLMAEHIGSVEFKNFVIADSRLSGIQISMANFTREDEAKINGAVIIGQTTNIDPDNTRYLESVGLTTPRTDNLLVNNVTFVNFLDTYKMSAIKSCSKCWHLKLKITGGKTTKFSNLKFINVNRKLLWEPLSTKKEVFVDLDGTFLETPGKAGSLTPYHKHLDGIAECFNVSQSIYDVTLVCNDKVQIRPIMFRNFQPNEAFRNLDLNLIRISDLDVNISTIQKDQFTIISMEKIFVDTKYTWASPFVTGYSYNMHWKDGNLDWTHMNMYPTPYWKPSDKGIVLRHNYSDLRETFDISIVRWNGTKTNVTKTYLPLDSNTPNNFSNGDFYHVPNKSYVSFGINGKINGTIDIDAVKCRYTCPIIVDNGVSEPFIRLWSNATMWPGSILPKEGDVVDIARPWRVLLDIDPPNLARLNIDGELIFDPSRDNKLTAGIIWARLGNITAGSPTEPFSKNILIEITGSRISPQLVIDPFIDSANKILAVTGAVKLYGNPPKVTWTKLAKNAEIGLTSVSVIEEIDWKVGDEIVITPSERNYSAHEKRIITAISNDKKTISFNLPLENFHYGDTKTTYTSDFDLILDMRASVGLLTRSIKITTDPNSDRGCNVLVYSFIDSNSTMRRGQIIFDGVEISNCGHQDTERASLDIKYVQTAGPISFLNKSSIHDGKGWCMNVFASKYVSINKNVFYNCEKFAVRGLHSNYFNFTYNLMIASRKRLLNPDVALYDMVAGLDMYVAVKDAVIMIENNVVQGGEGNGFVLPGGICNGENKFRKNHVNSVKYIGLIINENGGCMEMSDLTVSNSDGGIVTNMGGSGLILNRIILAENRIGTSANHAREEDENLIIHKNITYLALARPDCELCYSQKDSCQETTALEIPVIQIGGKSIPIDKHDPWGLLSICKDSAFDAKISLTDVTFINFKEDFSTDSNANYKKCGKKLNSIIFQMRQGPDSSASAYLSKTKTINSDNSTLFRLLEPNKAFLFWRGGCGDFNCTGEKNWYLTDLDGAFLGSKSQIIPINTGINSKCYESKVWNARQCDGWGFGILEFQNDGGDQRRRLISPLNITSKNMKNTLNEWREWKWEGNEPLDMRLARFNGLIELNTSFTMEFEVVVPEELKLQLQKGRPFLEFSLISIKYERPNIIEVWNMKTEKRINSFRIDNNVDLNSKISECGANIYDPDNRLINFILNNKNDCVLKVRTISAVKVSVHMEVSIDDFYKNNDEASFLDKISTFLKLDMARIRIVNVKKGSVILDFVVVENKPLTKSTNASETFDQNITNTTNQTLIDEYNKMKEELKNIGNDLKNGLTNGSAKIDNVLNVSVELLVQPLNIPNNNTNATTTEESEDESKRDLIIVLCTVLPGIFIIGLLICCCVKNKDGISLITLAFQFKMQKKVANSATVNANQELVDRSANRDLSEVERWKDPEAPFDERTGKIQIHGKIEARKYLDNK